MLGDLSGIKEASKKASKNIKPLLDLFGVNKEIKIKK